MSLHDSFERIGNPGLRLVRPGQDFREFRREEIEQSIPARFELQVERYPERLAVRTDEHELTYEQLNALANRIARAIRRRGGKGEEPVALLLGQGAPLVAAILASLKAGKLYVPLDSSHPPSRLADALKEAGAGLVLTDGRNRSLATELAGRRRVVLDVGEAGSGGTAENLLLPLSPETGACIFYTSGSTGRPKGVVDIHRNVLHNVLRYTNTLRISPEDRLSLIQSCSFSGTVSSLFGALLNGAAIFPFDLRSQGTARLAEWIVEQRITIFHSVPAIFRSIANGRRRFPDLRLIRLEGDQALRSDADRYREHAGPGCVLVNGLGATETGICRQYFIDEHVELESGLLPVGFPVQDMSVRLLDENGNQVAPGQTGEITVKSRYLARGYWGRPDLDRAAFLPDPAGGDERSYRTGDLGRFRPDGCLEYLGRKDLQLKIRGQRVEAAEVETALLRIPGVAGAVVATREVRPGEPRLIAYLVPTGGRTLAPSAVRRALARTLPDALIPTLLVTLDALPLDSNGKVDRRGLPWPVPSERTSPCLAPRDALEGKIAAIWKRELGISRVGVRDDFFDLGGDSLTAARVVAEVGRDFGRPVPPSLLLAEPTIEKLAAALREEGGRLEGRDPFVVLQTGSSERSPLFLVPDRKGGLFLLPDLARRLGEDQPSYAVRWTGVPEGSWLPRRIEEMAADGVARIRSAQREGGYRLAGFCFGGVVALEMARQLRSAGKDVVFLALIGVSPHDFPTLVPPLTLERYRDRSRAPSVRSRLAHHGTQLSQRRAAREKLRYLIGRGRSVGSFVRKRARLALGRAREKAGALAWAAACRWYEVAGRPVPARLRDADRISGRAFASYVPRADPGPVLLFLSRHTREIYSEDPVSDFGGLSTASVTVHEVPCHDGSMLIEPHVGVLAGQLRARLAESETLPRVLDARAWPG